MKIVSYNVNGLRPRLSNPPRTLVAFLDSLDADVICIQETKIARQELTADIAVAEGYESFFSCTRTSKKGRVGYSGVATFCRVGSNPSSTSPILPVAADEGFTGLLHRSQNGDFEAENGRVGCYDDVAPTGLSVQDLLQLDNEGRCLITDHGSFVLFNLYCPRVQCGDTERLNFKINFFRTLHRRWKALLRQNRRIIAVGDFNVSPYAIDSCAPGPNFEDNICRKWLRSLLRPEGGPFWDVFRFFHRGRKDAYTCWSQSSGAEEFNYGTRIDLVLAAGRCNHERAGKPDGEDMSHDFVQCEVQDSDILSHFKRTKPDAHPRWQGGRSLRLEGSDHAPISVQLREQRELDPHDVPPLAARFMPELRGRQQTLVSLLRKQPNLREGEAEGEVSESLESNDEAASSPLELSSDTRIVYTGLKGTSPTDSPGGSRKGWSLQRSLTPPDRKRKSVAGNSKKSDFQQDLRKFFGSSSSQSKQNAVRSRSLPSVHGLQETVKKSTEFIKSEEGKDVKEVSAGASDIGSSRSTDARDAEVFRESNFDNESEEMNVESGITRPAMTHTAAVNANAAWQAIKSKMAKAVPLCKGHREPCVGRVVKKSGSNKGRGFYVCARAEGPPSNPEARCDHFEWASSFKK